MKKIISGLLLLASTHVFAQWTNNPLVNNAIATLPAYQGAPDIASDGKNGAIITWYGNANATDNYIYAQRIDANGQIKWASNGVVLCSATGYRYFPHIIPDGSGGALIAWNDYRNGGDIDIYAQRIDSNGVSQWASNGIAVCNAANEQGHVSLMNLEPGNFLISWFDNRAGVTSDIYAQKLNMTGIPAWTVNGVAICTASGYQISPKMVTDNAAGAVITWLDNRSGNYDIYAQRINNAGAVQWPVNGVAVCSAPNSQGNEQLISDGSGGAIITWDDYRNGSSNDIYARRISAAGVPQWAVNGIVICNAPNYQDQPKIISDGSGGAIIVFMDLRNSVDFSNRDIYAQRINANGNILWIANGLPVCNNTADQRYPEIVTDNDGGAVITWMDKRGADQDIYAQIINANGTGLWQGNGIAVSRAANHQDNPVLVSDGKNGAILVWNDMRNGIDNDIYASRVTNGVASICPTGNTSFSSNLDGSNYQWQLSTDGGITFSNISDNNTYSGTATALLQLNNLPTSFYGYQYRCITDGNYSIVFKLRFVTNWTNLFSSSWEDPNNWSCGFLPDANTDVIINGGNVAVQSNPSVRTITVKAGANITVLSGYSLTIEK